MLAAAEGARVPRGRRGQRAEAIGGGKPSINGWCVALLGCAVHPLPFEIPKHHVTCLACAGHKQELSQQREHFEARLALEKEAAASRFEAAESDWRQRLEVLLRRCVHCRDPLDSLSPCCCPPLSLSPVRMPQRSTSMTCST